MNPFAHPVERLIVPMISMHFLCTIPAWSQRPASTLGPVVELELPFTPCGLVSLRSAGRQESAFALLDSAGARIHLYRLERNGELITTRQIPLAAPPSALLRTGDLNADGNDDLFILQPDPPALLTFIRSGGGFTQRAVPLEEPAGDCMVADINNDRRRDVLLFGRNRSGVQTLLGRSDGTLGGGPLLFPDISVGDLAAKDLNADGITDVVLADWLSNRMLMFYGIGRGVFSEQVSVDLADEPGHLVLMPVTRERKFGLAVTLVSDPSILVYEGDAAGNLTLLETLPLPEAARAVTTALLTADALLDMIVLSRGSVSVCSGLSPHTFASPVVFGPGTDLAAIAPGDADGDRSTDVACIDRKGRRLTVMGNARSAGGTVWPSMYAVGPQPRGIAVGDVDGDMLADIIVANSGSAQLSVLHGQPGGRFDGQEAVSVAQAPSSVVAVAAGEQTTALVTAHETVDNVSVAAVPGDSGRFSVVTIPTGSRPHVVLARSDRPGGRLEVLVRYEHGRDRSLSLSLFEQTGARQFLERSIRPSLAGRVLAMTIDDAPGGGYNLLYVSRTGKSGNPGLNLAPAGADFDFRRPVQLMTLSDSVSPVKILLTGFVDRDSVRDILVAYGPPRNAVAVRYGRSGNTASDSLAWVGPVSSAGEECLFLDDVDDDGAADLVWLDAEREAAMVAYQQTDGRFRPPSMLMRTRGASGIRVANLHSPLKHDLILSWGSRGVVSIHYDAFRKDR